MSQVIPVKIKPYLVPFFYKEFQGEEALFFGIRVKAVKVKTDNSLGKIIRLMCVKADKPLRDKENFNIFLKINDQENNRFGQIYRCHSGRNSFLMLPEEGVTLINDYLEDIFKTSFIHYIDAYKTSSDNSVNNAIYEFMTKYELLDEGLDPESLRRNYYRWSKDEKRLSFFHQKKSGLRPVTD